MSFVGNDILSLKDNSNMLSFSNQKYIRKILTEKELHFINNIHNINHSPYLFWTCKESAYKIALKMGLDQGFVPQYFDVNPLIFAEYGNIFRISGTVFFENNVYYFQSEISTEYISTIACTYKHGLSDIKKHIYSNVDSNQNNNIRKQIKIELAKSFNKDTDHFEIYKTEKGIPYIHSYSGNTMPDISISHDGNLFSYALLF
jgi:phosphopantetheinyl transferase